MAFALLPEHLFDVAALGGAESEERESERERGGSLHAQLYSITRNFFARRAPVQQSGAVSEPSDPLSSPARAAIVIAAIATLGFAAWGSLRRPPTPHRAIAVRGAEPPASEEPAAPSSTSASADAPDEPEPKTLDEQRQKLFARLAAAHHLSAAQMRAIEAIFAGYQWLGQGNPEISAHPMSRAECRRIRREAGALDKDSPLCGAPFMAPLYDPSAGEDETASKVCIDRYEFPDIPCEYPVVHVRARDAALICQAMGKRLCDAHEWEGGCAGALKPAETEYLFKRPRIEASAQHNATRAKVWAYGPQKDHARCATNSKITNGCPGGGYHRCGSNTYPTGAFPGCRSRFGVYDQHGNVAEHMSVPVVPEDLASRGGNGFTEMKGSWFIFSQTEAHSDDCHFRAPAWHESRVMDEGSHANYHLGFRCCKDVGR